MPSCVSKQATLKIWPINPVFRTSVFEFSIWKIIAFSRINILRFIFQFLSKILFTGSDSRLNCIYFWCTCTATSLLRPAFHFWCTHSAISKVIFCTHRKRETELKVECFCECFYCSWIRNNSNFNYFYLVNKVREKLRFNRNFFFIKIHFVFFPTSMLWLRCDFLSIRCFRRACPPMNEIQK